MTEPEPGSFPGVTEWVSLPVTEPESSLGSSSTSTIGRTSFCKEIVIYKKSQNLPKMGTWTDLKFNFIICQLILNLSETITNAFLPHFYYDVLVEKCFEEI